MTSNSPDKAKLARLDVRVPGSQLLASCGWAWPHKAGERRCGLNGAVEGR